jgi:RNA methyltransferase, TrmH family
VAEPITSAQNPKIKELIKLRERRARDKAGLFLVEGYREILRAVDAGKELRSLFFCPELFLGENESELLERSNARLFELPRHLFEKVSYRDRPDGLLAVAPQWQLSFDVIENEAPLIVLAERIEKPGNLGTILRCCDATGVDALLLCDQVTDLFNPNVVRASVGALFTVPVITCSRDEAIAALKGIPLVAATPAADKLYWEASLKRPVAIAVGAEQYGLSDELMAAADTQVRLPMEGSADSLNVAVATSVLLYDVLRQS